MTRKKVTSRKLSEMVREIKKLSDGSPEAQQRAALTFLDHYRGAHPFLLRLKSKRAKDPYWTPSEKNCEMVIAIMSKLAVLENKDPGEVVIDRMQRRMAHLPDSLEDPTSL